jgi:hypothetical protein
LVTFNTFNREEQHLKKGFIEKKINKLKGIFEKLDVANYTILEKLTYFKLFDEFIA